MFCKNCGSKFEENSIFCPGCGNPIVLETAAQQLAPITEHTVIKNTKRTSIIIGSILAILVLIGIIFYFNSLNGTNSSEKNVVNAFFRGIHTENSTLTLSCFYPPDLLTVEGKTLSDAITKTIKNVNTSEKTTEGDDWYNQVKILSITPDVKVDYLIVKYSINKTNSSFIVHKINGKFYLDMTGL